jgi:hypothetical protein
MTPEDFAGVVQAIKALESQLAVLTASLGSIAEKSSDFETSPPKLRSIKGSSAARKGKSRLERSLSSRTIEGYPFRMSSFRTFHTPTLGEIPLEVDNSDDGAGPSREEPEAQAAQQEPSPSTVPWNTAEFVTPQEPASYMVQHEHTGAYTAQDWAPYMTQQEQAAYMAHQQSASYSMQATPYQYPAPFEPAAYMCQSGNNQYYNGLSNGTSENLLAAAIGPAGGDQQQQQQQQPHQLLPNSQEKNPTTVQPEDGVRLDGGRTAWTQVLVSFLLVFDGFGYFSAFGLFQSHWTVTLNATPSDIAWVGSVMLFLLFFLGIFSGPLLDRGYFRSLLIVGCGFQVVGAFSTSGVSQYWQLMLAQGFVQGIGNGLLFTPCVALVSTYFDKKRAFALSIAACGAPVGGIVFPLVSANVHMT